MRHVHRGGLRSKLGAAVLATTTAMTAVVGLAGTAGADTRSASAVAAAQFASGTADVKKRLRALENSYQGRIGAYAIDTGTGKTISYRGGELFPSASTFKAVLCGAILAKARTTDPGLLNRTLRWTAKELVTNSPITELPENLKNGMTVDRLCHAAVTASDNTAANLLLKQIGGPAGLTRYYRSLGDPIGRLDRWEPELNDWKPDEKRDTIKPAFMARNLQKLTLGSTLVPEDRQRLNDWLRASVTGTERIRAGLPKNWTVGDKTGGGSGPYAPGNDIAVAWPPSGAPLIIAVYTNRNDPTATMDNSVIAKAATLLAEGLGYSGRGARDQ
ncbi:class A beta-lactamase [Nonomuraea spiralis]|uniref:class A beta-lactamase n=1 Tax=Nonomuraea TaxID=83681 RepID=UPI000F7B53DC|nr:class A beta-lactamase [Nonomuraea sp. WAC 01424]RSN05776.1 class A beta-lactamase [Nonomuraea sp. WAC 01424]